MRQPVSVAPQESGFDPASPDVLRNPYPHYHWLLRNDPVHRGTHGIWYISRYRDVRSVMNDPRFGRAGIRDFWATLVGPGPLSEILRRTIFFQDEPDHGRLRTLIAPLFAPRVVRALEAKLSLIVDDLLAPVVPRGEMDVINDFAYPLALSVIAEILGVPVADRDRLREWSLGIGPTLDLVASPEEVARGQAAMGEFVDYLTGIIARRRGHDHGDLLGVMLAAHRDNAGASMTEILSTVVTLVFAGHETVTNQIGNGVLAFIRHPEQAALVRRRPELLPGAVEECLRYDSSVQSNSRQLGQDVEFGGRQMRRGEFVVVLAGAANRDPEQFADPDRFDVTRTDVQPMSFGAGIRFCLGAVLARLEARAAFRRLVQLEDLRLAVPDAELVYQRSTMFRGLERLPVTFGSHPAGTAAPRPRSDAKSESVRA